MTIVKRKAKKKNYSIIDNAGIHDRGISWQATGLWTWFMSKPDDWEVNLENLCSSKTNGKDSTLSTLSELEQAGYLIYQRWRNNAGQFESVYTVFESPEQLNEWKKEADPIELKTITKVACGKGRKKTRSGKPTVDKPQREIHSGKPAVDKPQWENRSGKTTAENPQQLNTDIQSTELLNTDSLSIELLSTELNPPLAPQGEQEGGEELTAVDVEIVQEESAEIPSLDAKAIHASTQESDFSSEGKNSATARDNKKTVLERYENGEVENLPRYELIKLAKQQLGGLVQLYRKSGIIQHSSPNDIDRGFLSFLAKRDRKDSQYASRLVSVCERNPARWGELTEMVKGWQSKGQFGGYSAEHVALVNEIYANIADL